MIITIIVTTSEAPQTEKGNLEEGRSKDSWREQEGGPSHKEGSTLCLSFLRTIRFSVDSH